MKQWVSRLCRKWPGDNSLKKKERRLHCCGVCDPSLPFSVPLNLNILGKFSSGWSGKTTLLPCQLSLLQVCRIQKQECTFNNSAADSWLVFPTWTWDKFIHSTIYIYMYLHWQMSKTNQQEPCSATIYCQHCSHDLILMTLFVVRWQIRQLFWH